MPLACRAWITSHSLCKGCDGQSLRARALLVVCPTLGRAPVAQHNLLYRRSSPLDKRSSCLMQSQPATAAKKHEGETVQDTLPTQRVNSPPCHFPPGMHRFPSSFLGSFGGMSLLLRTRQVKSSDNSMKSPHNRTCQFSFQI